MVSIDDLHEVVHELFKEPIIGPLKPKTTHHRHLENRHDVIFFCRGWSDLDKISQTDGEWHVDCGDIVEIETRSRIPIWRTFGWINGMSSQSHVSHCRVLPLGELTVMIPEPHATLQCVRIPFAILKIVSPPYFIFFCFLNAVWALTSCGFRIVSDTLVTRDIRALGLYINHRLHSHV